MASWMACVEGSTNSLVLILYSAAALASLVADSCPLDSEANEYAEDIFAAVTDSSPHTSSVVLNLTFSSTGKLVGTSVIPTVALNSALTALSTVVTIRVVGDEAMFRTTVMVLLGRECAKRGFMLAMRASFHLVMRPR